MRRSSAVGSNRKSPAPPVPGARPGALPAFLEPSQALLSDKPAERPELDLLKYDGYRIRRGSTAARFAC